MKEDWIQVKLGEVCNINMGQSPPSSTYNTDKIGLPFFQGKAEFTELYPDVKKWCSEPKKTAEAGDILLSVRAPVGSINMANQKCAIGRGLASITYKYCTPYIWFYLKSIEKKLDSKGTGTTFKAISGSVLKSQKTPFSPLPIQRAIVAKIEALFSDLENGIANLNKVQEQLKIYRQAVLKKAFEGDLIKVKFERLKINEIGEIITGNTPSKKNIENYSARDYNFYKPTDLEAGDNVISSNDYLSVTGYRNSRQVEKDSILVTCIGATIGKTGLVKKEGGFNQQINAIIPLEKHNPKFIYYQAISMNFQTQIKTNASSTTLPIINKGKFSKLIMNICDRVGQNQIVKEIESRLSVCDKVEESIIEALTNSEALRQSILKKAFEGKLLSPAEIEKCKKEADYEPAIELLRKIKAKN